MSSHIFDKEKLIQAARDLRAHADQTFAMYLDAERGWSDQENQLRRLKEANMTKLGFSEEEALNVVMAYAARRKDGDEIVLHESSVAKTLSRISRGGANHVFLANMCAAWLYAFWETQGRDQLAAAFHGKHEIVQSDLFGDLRLIRHCILHCKSVADSRVDRCKMIKWFKKGDRIEFNAARLHQVVRTIRNLADSLEEVANNPSAGIKSGSVLYGKADALGNYIDPPPEGMRLGSPLPDPTPSMAPMKLASNECPGAQMLRRLEKESDGS